MVAGAGRFECEVVVVGGGPAGLMAAVALAGADVPTTLVAGQPRSSADNRTTALLAGSVNALDAIGAWTRCREHAAPLRSMRIVDDTGRLWRAPEVRFDAAEIGLEAFGWNIENRHLVAALAARVGDIPLLRIDEEASNIEIADDHVTVALAGGGRLTSRLVVAADGRGSRCRAAAGIETDRRSYPQTALTFNLGHARPHHDISTEFHTADGPFTLVPLPGLRSSLVWVVSPGEANHLDTLDAAELGEEIERRAHSILGKIAVEPGHGAFPLGIETARRLAATRIALVGEAGHVLPPIGAQGLNLGLRDAAVIGELVVAARRSGEDVGGPALTDAFDRARRADVASRSMAVDLLNRSLLSDFLPVQGARGLSLYLLDQIGPLRRAVMREGVVPRMAEPRLMRGEAL